MIVDDLSQTIYDRKQKNTKAWLDELVLTQNAHSLSFDLETMKEDTRFAGRAKVSFRARIQQPTAILSAMLVEKGKQIRLTSDLDGDENHSFVFKMEEKPSDYFVITRGWMNAQNRLNNYSKEAITTNEINRAFPVPNLSEKKPPPTFPNKENHRFIAASVAPNVTVAPKIDVAYGVK
jgi:hypothetical protein